MAHITRVALPLAVALAIATPAWSQQSDAGLEEKARQTLESARETADAAADAIRAAVSFDAMPPLPRVGWVMTLPEGFEGFAWYGRGPHESYSDRLASAAVGLYGATVDAQYHPYIMPQETGNKTDVRWAALTRVDGVALLATALPAAAPALLNVSALHYTAADLTVARHTHELCRRPETILTIDALQSGLGGESCGPATLPQYLVEPVERTFRVRLRPYVENEEAPMSLARQAFEEL